MSTRTLFLIVALLGIEQSALADWDNPTFDQIADGATYYSAAEPCALQISKASTQAELYVTYTQNPVYWFPGFDGYRDAAGIDRLADRCPGRNEVRVFFCPSHLNHCESSAEGDKDRTLEITDAGDLIESSLTAELLQTPHTVLHPYSSGVAQAIACHTQTRATAAATYLTEVRDQDLDDPTNGCEFNVTDADRGISMGFYKGSCVARQTLKVYVANIRDRLFVDAIIALASQAFEGEDGQCFREARKQLEGSGYAGDLVTPKCAKAELSAAIDSLTSMAQAAAAVCSPARR